MFLQQACLGGCWTCLVLFTFPFLWSTTIWSPHLLLLLWSPSITGDDDFLFNVEDTKWREKIHVLKKFKVRRGCTVPSPLTWPSTKKSDGTKEFAKTDSMDGCNVLSETQFVGTRLCVDTTRVLYVGVPFPLVELPERGQILTSNSLSGLHSWFFLEVISWSLFHKWILPQDSGGLKSEFSISKGSCQRQSSHTCPFASYTAGNSVPTCGLRLRPSR